MESPIPNLLRGASAAFAAGAPAGHVLPPSPRRFARSAGGVVLAVLAGLRLLLGALWLAGGDGVGGRLLVLASLLYLGYFFWARGVLKTRGTVLTGMAAAREIERENV